MYLKPIVLISMAALSTTVHAGEAVGDEWPMCKGRIYKIEKWMAYNSSQLSPASANESMERLSKIKGNPLDRIGDDNGFDDLQRLQGYILRVKADSAYHHLEKSKSDLSAIKLFCDWITTNGEDD